ncbi:fatty acid-binding protein homolog 6-like isoform X2 [Microplitis mediator]|uniref:fatty acid-binding protein homolog 6-like isoform X2 n=1 Tax=Microplitis mediator TaxID=375433 RepID=UPI0025576311|nr:fatty acid-binding protein homolog 6-like isoform X2 [Microplitis mediator]
MLVTIAVASVYSDSLLKTLSNTLTMVQIIGKYEHESSEGLEAYLKTVGGVENQEASKAFSQGKPTLEISQSGDHWIITVSNEGKSSTTKFTLGTPYDETMPHGLTLKSVTTRDGNKFITVSDLPDGNKSIRVYEFTDTGITVHLSENKHGVKAVRTYKRI